jgi:hypothetical protein
MGRFLFHWRTGKDPGLVVADDAFHGPVSWTNREMLYSVLEM